MTRPHSPPHKKVPNALVRVWNNYTKTRNWLISTAAGIVTLGAAWALVGSYAEAIVPVTHAYARSTIIPRIILAQLDANKERRERLLRENKDRELEMKSPGAQALPQYKQELQESIDRNSAELKELDDASKALVKERQELGR